MVYPQQREQQLRTALQRLGLPETAPVNLTLLNLAFTHPSADQRENYEKLEFLGDAVIRLLASEVLMAAYPDAPVGDHAAIRSILVSDRVLAQWGERYGFDRYLLTAQRRNGLSQKFVRLADIFEAVLGALYSSTRDMSLIEDWLTPLLREKAAEIHADPAFYNYKDALQEWTQGEHKLLPDYRVQEQSDFDAADERFRAEVWLKDDCLGAGWGPTKKAAEQAAAKAAFTTVVQPSMG